MRKIKIAAVFFIAAGVVFLVSEAISASAWNNPSYSYAHYYVSDLGIPIVTEFDGLPVNSPLFIVMDFGFISYALLFLTAYILMLPVLSGKKKVIGLVLAAIHGMGFLFVGLFPGYEWEFGFMHAIGASMVLYGGDLMMLLTGLFVNREFLKRWFAIISALLCVTGLAGLFILIRSNFGYKGVFERIAIYPFIIWCVIFGSALLSRTIAGIESVVMNRRERT
jgi:hypothetical membrane protein